MRNVFYVCGLMAAWTAFGAAAGAQEPAAFQQPAITVPDGYTVELAAGPPLVTHPIMAGFDDRGRLYVAETAGINMQRAELEEKLPNYVSRLEDTDGDGKFDKRTTFADKLTFPQGALWHDGWLYVASSGAIWRFQDKDDDGVAEVREKIVGSFGYTGNAADVHGCFLGPEGRIWWCEGRHGHEIVDSTGNVLSKGKAARIFSSRPDGSDVQVHCGGGMDNPVEIDWTEEGEVLGTVNIFYHKRGDCLVHWMHGGLYPRHDQPAVLAEFKKTGEPLDAVHDYGHVAVSGLCRIRGTAFPLPLGEGRDEGVASGFASDAPPSPLPQGGGTKAGATFLVTEFNTHKVVRTDLTRDGATFRAETHDFLQAASDDFHPTDVLEDADGSLLVIDTGGWFRIGCPTSQIAKPNILGAIYRVRRTEAKQLDDPRGLATKWSELEAAPLVKLLADERPAVRERALHTLASQGDTAIPFLSRALTSKDATIRRNAVWALTRMGSPKAQQTVRLIGLSDRDPSALSAAVYSTGLTRDEAVTGDLIELLENAETPPQIAREAATALGKISDAAAAGPLLQTLARDNDRVLEHALIYALIEINNRDATAVGLASDLPRVRRAALIALDQMPAGNLTRDEVAALLDTTDQPLLTAALDVISRHPGWSDELVTLAGKLLAQPELSESEQALVSGALVGLATNEKVQALVAESLGSMTTPQPAQLLLLDVIARSGLRPLAPSWVEPLSRLLVGDDDTLAVAVTSTVVDAESEQFDEQLIAIARDSNRQYDRRLSALGAASSRLKRLDEGDFAFLMSALDANASAEGRSAAARALSAAPLNDTQRLKLLGVLRSAGPLEISSLLAPFEHVLTPELAPKLLDAISASPGARSAPLDLQIRLINLLPSVSEEERREVLLSLKARAGIDPRRLNEIELSLPTGGVPSGQTVFFSRKAACSSCHRVGSEGGKIGPDLSKVGERRNERDLLEAIVFPSASIARGFESHAILTADGINLTGLVVRETPDSLFLRTHDQREVRLKRADIEAQKPSELSIMPAGLENTISRQELADLIAYLRSLK